MSNRRYFRMAIPMATGMKVTAPSSKTSATGVVDGTQYSADATSSTAIA
jgi:hypothetical protein